MTSTSGSAYGAGQGEGANSVLGKARLILESFTLDDVDLSLAEISRRTGISKPSVHRLNQELLDWGMLERSGQAYRLGLRAFELGSRVPRFRVLRDAVRPHMESLCFSTKETVHLAVLDGLEVLYLEKIVGTPQATKPSRIAGRMPLHATATGKVLLAHSPRTVLDAVVARGLERITSTTVVSSQLLNEQVAKARADGYATEFEEVTLGYCSVAVPLFGPTGLLLASLAITAPIFRADTRKFAMALTAVSRKVAIDRSVN
ncbi:IclR family transcriptional regulator [Nocardioides sp. GXZ039]|uniref:IclR family transcriptional regulator n=1 Tax=Nocardioides sp. GXZ039 TaxID=3136018 RepID=UPI0030F41C93